MLFTGSSINIGFTIDTAEDTSEATVQLTVKNTVTRLTKDTIVNEDGSYSVLLTSLETATPGTYYVQPVLVYGNGDKIPGDIRSFELQEGL